MTTETTTPICSFDDMRDVQSVLYREYMTEIESIATETLSELRDENPDATADEIRETFDDRLWETIDGHNWIIYNHKAKLVLWVSDNEDAYENENGEAGASDNVRAFYAMRADCMDYAERNHILDEPDDEEEDDTDDEEAT